MGLSARGALYAGQKRASETTDIVRQNENLYLKNDENVLYYSYIYLLTKENLYLKLYLSVSKIGINAFIKVGLSSGGLYEGLIRRITQMLRKSGLTCGGAYTRGGAYRQRNTVMSQSIPSVTIPPRTTTRQIFRNRSNPGSLDKFFGQIPFPRANSIGQIPRYRANFPTVISFQA